MQSGGCRMQGVAESTRGLESRVLTSHDLGHVESRIQGK